MIYENGRQRQNVWTKKSWEVKDTPKKSAKPVRLNYKQAKELEKKNLSQFRGLTSGAESGIIETENQRLLRSAVASGDLPLTINPEKQARHILAEGETAKPDGRSFLTIDIETAQEIVNTYYATGDVIYVPSSSKFKEFIEVDIALGVDGKSGMTTNQAFINYSKTGTHLVPTKKGRDKND